MHDQSHAITNRISDMARELGLELGFAARHPASGAAIDIAAGHVFPTASVFKVPVMLEVLRQIEQGTFSLDQRLSLRSEDKTLTTGILLTLQDDLPLTLRDLMTLMIIISDNTATTMLLNLVGKQAVVKLLVDLGCLDSTCTMSVHEMFLHAWNLPLDRPVSVAELASMASTKQMDYASLTFARNRDNTVSTAADMAHLMALIATGTAVSPWVSAQAFDIMRQTQTTDRVPRFLPFRSVANKTGTFRGLRNDSGIITRGADDHIAYSVFTFDPMALPLEDTRLFVRRNTLVAEFMGEIGAILFEEFGL